MSPENRSAIIAASDARDPERRQAYVTPALTKPEATTIAALRLHDMGDRICVQLPAHCKVNLVPYVAPLVAKYSGDAGLGFSARFPLSAAAEVIAQLRADGFMIVPGNVERSLDDRANYSRKPMLDAHPLAKLCGPSLSASIASKT